jgi:prevent-host-death family protein
MKTIPQRTLRNESGEVLRQAEAGERFVVTVHGRPVAVLGPYERRQWVPTAAVRDLLRTPTDPTLLDDLREMDAYADLADPWLRSAK